MDCIKDSDIEDLLRSADIDIKGKNISYVTREIKEMVRDRLPDIIEGMEVSIDVSTGEHDEANRLFGVVNECMSNPSKNDMILLVYETEPNFPIDDRISTRRLENIFNRLRWALDLKLKEAGLVGRKGMPNSVNSLDSIKLETFKLAADYFGKLK